MSKPFTFALIGVGMVAETHVRALADLAPDVQLKGVCGREKARLQAFKQTAEQHCGHELVAYEDAAQIAADPEIDGVIIATPPNARTEIVETLSAAGKAICMEKPIERSLVAARGIVETCVRNQAPLGIFFQHRVRQASQDLMALLSNEGLGKIGLVEVSVPWWREQSYYDEPGRGTYDRDGGGVLISQAIHTLDLMLQCFGGVETVQAMSRTTHFHDMESEDTVTAGIQFACGAIGSMMATTAAFPGGAESIRVHGDKGSATLASGVLKVDWRNGQSETFGQTATTGGGADPMAFTHDWHKQVIADFVAAVTAGEPVPISGRQALDVHALIEALIMSSDQKREVRIEEVSP